MRTGRSRLLANFGSNLGLLGANLAIGIFFTPFLVRHLGAGGYGMVLLANTAALYLGLLLTGFNSAVGRYVTVEMGRGEIDKARQYFNSAVFGGLAAGCLLAVLGVIVCFHIEALVRAPAGRLAETRWLFAATLAATILGTMRTAFSASTYCRNRLDLSNGVGLLDKVTSAGWVVIAFALGAIVFDQVAIGIVAGALVSTVLTIFLWKKLTPELELKASQFRWTAFRELLSTGLWGSVNAAGSLLFLSVDLIVVNRLFGAESGGRYAAVMQITAVLRSVGAALSGAFGPTIVHLHARGDLEGLLARLMTAIRIMRFLLPLPIGILAGFSNDILALWLGNDFTSMGWLLILSTLHLSVNLAVLPMFLAWTATNHVKTPALVTLAMGIGSAALAIALGRTTLGIAGVAVAGVISLSAKNLIFTPLYTAHVLDVSCRKLYATLFHSAFATMVVAVTSGIISHLTNINGFVRLATAATLIGVVYVAVVILCVITEAERTKLRHACQAFFNERKRKALYGE
ncbi:MAG: hypothetical protein DVB32_01920 [Verrucomicrobia bacterium]|nr:MAG: hypothetical protein DVB32_01920 [Verrucomicrobiota bacterium]